MEAFGGPRRPSLAIAQRLNANGATWLGTIHGQAAWIRLRLSGTRWRIVPRGRPQKTKRGRISWGESEDYTDEPQRC